MSEKAGKYKGRKPALSPQQVAEIKRRVWAGESSGRNCLYMLRFLVLWCGRAGSINPNGSFPVKRAGVFAGGFHHLSESVLVVDVFLGG